MHKIFNFSFLNKWRLLQHNVSGKYIHKGNSLTDRVMCVLKKESWKMTHVGFLWIDRKKSRSYIRKQTINRKFVQLALRQIKGKDDWSTLERLSTSTQCTFSTTSQAGHLATKRMNGKNEGKLRLVGDEVKGNGVRVSISSIKHVYTI